jgi:hypothetical protein
VDGRGSKLHKSDIRDTVLGDPLRKVVNYPP